MSMIEKNGNKVAAVLLAASALGTGFSVYTAAVHAQEGNNPSTETLTKASNPEEYSKNYYIEETEAVPKQTKANFEEAIAIALESASLRQDGAPAAHAAPAKEEAEAPMVTEAVAVADTTEAPAAPAEAKPEAKPTVVPVVAQPAPAPVTAPESVQPPVSQDTAPAVPEVQTPADSTITVQPVETPAAEEVLTPAPEAPAPEAPAPEAPAPESPAPEAPAPEAPAPEAPAPEAPAPEAPAPESPAPEAPAPEAPAPEAPAPEAPAPEAPAPEAPAPEAPAPEAPAPEAPAPEAPAPEAPAPEAPAPEAPAANPYADLNANIASEALKLVDVTNGMQCTEVVQMAMANAGVVDALTLWPDQYVTMYGSYTDNPQPGNLIYYTSQGGRGTDHIAVFIGNGQAVHGNYWVDGQSYTTVANVDLPGFTGYNYIQVER